MDVASIYKKYDQDQYDNLFSQFLVNSWSYSKVTQFARNEKAFEMIHIYGVYSKSSASSVAGSAYHAALQYFFTQLKEGVKLDVIELEASAFMYIDNMHGNQWKLSATTQTVEECIAKATYTASKLIVNFLKEIDTYLDDIQEVIFTELRLTEWVVINGVDIPIPCNGIVDLVVRTKDGKIAAIDHKSKATYTPDDEIALSVGLQAITYVKLLEEHLQMKIDEVWFVENKHSANKNKSPQLQLFKIEMDDNSRHLYEALLYEPLKKMVEAVNNPDYIYLINDSDNYVDKAEIYDFWARTQIGEVEDFNVDESKKEMVAKRLKKVKDSSIQNINPNVIRKFKENASSFIKYDLSDKNMTPKEKIEHVLRSFGTTVNVAKEFSGYSSNTYLLEVSAGVKIGSISSHKLDIANALNVENVRIGKELTVYEGRSYLAVDFSKKREADLIFDPFLLVDRKIPIGKDNFNNTIVWDFDNHSTPHALICGATGSGKSVCIRSIIEYAKLADVDEIYIFDPKHEFRAYHDNCQVFVYSDIEDIEEQMELLVLEMNESIKAGKRRSTLVVFDEFADALAQSRKGSDLDIKENVQTGWYAPKKGMFGIPEPPQPKMALKTTGTRKSLEENLKILLQKGRSIGYRILAATQRASVQVITGDAKVNFPVQICFRVPKEADSRVVIDEAGAESLSGRGDGLLKSPEYKDVIRFQAFYKP